MQSRTDSMGAPPYQLRMQDDNQLCVYDANNECTWCTGVKFNWYTFDSSFAISRLRWSICQNQSIVKIYFQYETRFGPNWTWCRGAFIKQSKLLFAFSIGSKLLFAFSIGWLMNVKLAFSISLLNLGLLSQFNSDFVGAQKKFKIKLHLGSYLTLELRKQIMKWSLLPTENANRSLLSLMNTPLDCG